MSEPLGACKQGLARCSLIITACLVLAGCTTSPADLVDPVEEPVRVAVPMAGQQYHALLFPTKGILVVEVTSGSPEALPMARLVLSNTMGEVVHQSDAPALLPDLAPGKYRLQVSAEGHIAVDQNVIVREGVITKATVSLPAATPSNEASSTAAGSFLPPKIPTGLVATVLGTCFSVSLIAAWRTRPGARTARAQRHLSRGRTSAAEKLTGKVLQRRPNFADALFLRGACLLKQGLPAEAVRLLEQASSRHDPHMAGWAFLITLAHRDLGQPEQARRWLPMVARDPQYWNALLAEPGAALDLIIRPRPAPSIEGYA